MSIHLDARRDAQRAGNASRKRRFSVDPARRAWYSADRARRFADRFGPAVVSR